MRFADDETGSEKNTSSESLTTSGSGSPVRVFRSNLGPITVMLFAVGCQITGAALLKTIADHHTEWGMVLLVVGVIGVIGLNLLRLVVWGFAHRRYPLSTTYPLSSLFFPAMLIVAVAFGDEIGLRQVLGALLITTGTLWLSVRVSS